MKWFKHMTNLRNEEPVARYFDATGLQGYGFYCMVMEMVGESMGPRDQRCELSLPIRRWSKSLGISQRKVLYYATELGNTGLAIVGQNGNEIRIKMDKLAQLRDEYSRKSGDAHEHAGTDSTQIRAESDQIKEKNKSDSDQILERHTDREKRSARTMLVRTGIQIGSRTAESGMSRMDEILKRYPHLRETS